MRVLKTLLTFILAMSLLSGCLDASNTAGDTSALSHESEAIDEGLVTVNGRSFSIEEINAGIKDMFNCRLYHHNYDNTLSYILLNKDVILGKDVEYDLYYLPPNSFIGPQIYFVLNNIEHPLSSEEEPLVYSFGISITEWGLQPQPSLGGSSPPNKDRKLNNKDAVYLGSYTMRIDEIVKPPFEIMDDEWTENVESAIRLYMDNSVTLAPGSYHVYVDRFFKSDDHSEVFFEHENGNIYFAVYNSIHFIMEDYPANLSNVSLWGMSMTLGQDYYEKYSGYMKEYFGIIKLDPAISMEYTVE